MHLATCLALVALAQPSEIDVLDRMELKLNAIEQDGVERMVPTIRRERIEELPGETFGDRRRMIRATAESVEVVISTKERTLDVLIESGREPKVKEYDWDRLGETFDEIDRVLGGGSFEDAMRILIDKFEEMLEPMEERWTGRHETIAGVECRERFRKLDWLGTPTEVLDWIPVDEWLAELYGSLQSSSYEMEGGERKLVEFSRTLSISHTRQPMPDRWPVIYDDEHCRPLGSKEPGFTAAEAERSFLQIVADVATEHGFAPFDGGYAILCFNGTQISTESTYEKGPLTAEQAQLVIDDVLKSCRNCKQDLSWYGKDPTTSWRHHVVHPAEGSFYYLSIFASGRSETLPSEQRTILRVELYTIAVLPKEKFEAVGAGG